MISFFPLAVQLQVCLVAFERVNADNIILHAPEQYHVACGKVCPVADLKQHFFVKLRGDAVQFFHGKLPEVRPYGCNRDSYLFAIADCVRYIAHFLNIYFLVFQLHFCRLSGAISPLCTRYSVRKAPHSSPAGRQCRQCAVWGFGS